MGSRIHTVIVLVLFLALCGCHAQPAGKSSDAVSRKTPEPAPWYEAEIQAFEAADKASPPRPGQVLFVGSSSIRLWSSLAADMNPVPVLNRGFGGSKTGDVLSVFDRIVLPYKPSVIVYYCGDNDLGTTSTDSQAAADGFIKFDRRARTRWSDIRVFYIPIKPSVQRWNNWAAMKKANDIVRAYCERTPGATYLDTVSPALAPDGRPDPSIFREDGLHMNAKGYAIWTSVVRPPVLEAWRKAAR